MTEQILAAATVTAPGASSTSRPGMRRATPGAGQVTARPVVQGKFLYAGGQKLYVKGVTYGTFGPAANGEEYDREMVETDFRMMTSHGINAVRVYTPPPRWLLDAAQRHGLRVMVGLPWEQHIAFLDGRTAARSIMARVSAAVRSCAGHPALLCFAIGNEIPASIVRWHGARRTEAFLRRLAEIVREEDPGALVTYVNFPSTEYLRLDFVDFVSFNVYLESPETLDPYLARLQNLAGEKPLMMAEIGLDSRRNGEDAQAAAMAWQIQSVFAAGAAGAIVFAWTDEWHRGGFEIEDWDFGLVDRERRPKAALAAVTAAFVETPFPARASWPRMSVVVCSYNGSRTIADTLEGLAEVDYPNFEVIVVDDGSTDNLAEIASRFDVRLIRTSNQGLAAARNEGMRAATGEIIAYLDDDARPDPHWLQYLADAFGRTRCVAAGGPNIAPAGDGMVAEAVAHAPGGPVHVLVTDAHADHLPGCNLSVRRSALEAIGGFDPRYRAAGDDVDVCWRLREAGGELRFSPGAMVWHHRRNSARAYWKQQLGYGKAEALLEEKWPERYNAMGHLAWSGRIYGNGLTQALGRARERIYHGSQGSALFQSMYQPAPGLVSSLPLMPEWWLLVTAMASLGLLGLAWPPLLWAWPLFFLAALAPVAQAVKSGVQAPIATVGRDRFELFKLRTLIAWLHLVQPLARLRGRIRSGLAPWRMRRTRALGSPLPRTVSVWSETWRSPERWLDTFQAVASATAASLRVGGDYDRWDLAVHVGPLGDVRLLLGIEEHGGGKQLARFRMTPTFSIVARVLIAGLATSATLAAIERAWLVAAVLGTLAILVLARWLVEVSLASGSIQRGLREASQRA